MGSTPIAENENQAAWAFDREVNDLLASAQRAHNQACSCWGEICGETYPTYERIAQTLRNRREHEARLQVQREAVDNPQPNARGFVVTYMPASGVVHLAYPHNVAPSHRPTITLCGQTQMGPVVVTDQISEALIKCSNCTSLASH